MTVDRIADVAQAPVHNRGEEVLTPATIDAYHRALRRFWHPVLRSEDLPAGELRGVTLLDEPVVLAQLNGEIVALQDLCRHFQAQLSLGEITRLASHGDCVMCPYHGWSYAATGQCVDIPQLGGERQIPAEAREQLQIAWISDVDQALATALQ